MMDNFQINDAQKIFSFFQSSIRMGWLSLIEWMNSMKMLLTVMVNFLFFFVHVYSCVDIFVDFNNENEIYFLVDFNLEKSKKKENVQHQFVVADKCKQQKIDT